MSSSSSLKPQAPSLFRVRMLGLKGLPGTFGGVEKHVEELAARLAARGHDVTAYCRRAYTPSEAPVRGVKIRLLPTIHTKHLDATVHTLLGAFHAVCTRADIVHFHGIGPAAFAVIPRLFGKKVVTTIHSRDYLRSKWGPFARAALRIAERVALAASHRVVCVSREMAESFARRGNVRYIPNGVPDPACAPPGDFLRGLGLAGNDYLLYAGRISPEKGPQHLLRAFARVHTALRLVLAGGSSHTGQFEKQVDGLARADPRVIMPGYVDAAKMPELYASARGFILSSEHEGMPIALLEAMSYGVPSVCTRIPAAVEAATGEDGKPVVIFADDFSPEVLQAGIERLLADPQNAAALGEKGRAHVLRHYRWDKVAKQTEEVYREAVTGLTGEEAALPCPACGAMDKTLEYARTRSGRIAKCAACGMVFSISPPPTEAQPPAVTDDPEAYLENAKHRLGFIEELQITNYELQKIQNPPSLKPQAPSLLDVGCFDGHFAGAAKKLGYEVTGVEPVASAAEKARADYGLDVRTGTFEDAKLPAAAFDIVSFIHVFEHLKDPRAALRRASEALKPDGFLLIEIPAYDAFIRRATGRRWRQFIADHDRFYTGPVLRKLIESEGFQILHESKVGKVLTPRLLADRVGRYYSRALGRIIGRIADVLGIASRCFTLNLGDIRLLAARKRAREL